MPKAGWCKECGDWVWVDHDGACVNGHGPECIGGVYESEPQTPQQAAERGFGIGEMPAELHRFNWGAFYLPLFWGIAHGSVPILTAVIISYLVPLGLATLVTNPDGQAMLGVLVVSQIVTGFVRVWSGASANGLAWQREAMITERVTAGKPRYSIERFASRQRVWAIVTAAVSVGAIALLALMMGTFTLTGTPLPKDFPLEWLDVGLAAFWLAAEIGVGLWFAAQMRAEFPEAAPTDNAAR